MTAVGAVMVATGAAKTVTGTVVEVETSPGGLVTLQEIDRVPDAAVKEGVMVIERVPCPVKGAVAPVPVTVQAKVPDCDGTLATKLVPAVAFATVETVELGSG